MCKSSLLARRDWGTGSRRLGLGVTGTRVQRDGQGVLGTDMRQNQKPPDWTSITLVRSPLEVRRYERSSSSEGLGARPVWALGIPPSPQVTETKS